MARTSDWENDHSSANITLSRVLTALENQVQDEKNLQSTYQRNKLSANVEYARSLLLRLEHDSTSIKIASRKQTVQADLQRKRELIKRLQMRLQEPAEAQEEDSDSDSDSDSDDSLNEFSPAPTAPSSTSPAPSTLRARKPRPSSSPPPSHTTARSALLGAASTRSQARTAAPLDSQLTAHRAEQTDLTDSLLGLARALKASSAGFGAALAAEKDVLARAGAGLDSNVVGMEDAGGRLGRLRRAAEGRGWWGRMMLFAYVGALWVVALVLVVVLPKLRF